MREFGIEHIIGAHCTGINALSGLRISCGLSRQTAVVGAVGSTFTLGEGIHPGALNR
jgi:7,8-dihydropterin-6-yl-methyl-4-(beta-D-ribofuranosyl)aminobenzene 5'-phosphate synthase